MRIMTLSEMVAELRAEAGISSNVAHGAAVNDAHRMLLRRTQEELLLAHDWPHLKMYPTKVLTAGGRYWEYPEHVELDGVLAIDARVTGSNDWRRLGYGIGPNELDRVDSNAGDEGQVERWQHYIQITGNTNHNMFEVWPIPEAETTLRFEARHGAFPLIADADESTIDGPVIVLHAAGQLLARLKSEDASLKLDMGIRRLRLLLKRQAGADNRVLNMAQGVDGTYRYGSPRFPE